MWIGAASRQLFQIRGETVRWWRSAGPCPCFNPIDGTFDSTHTLCQGTGELLEEVPLPPTYRAIIGSATARKEYLAQFGQIKSGDLVCSTYPEEIGLAHGDVLLSASRDTVFSEVITRGTGTGPGNGDLLSQIFATVLVRVFSLTSAIASGFSLAVDPTTGASSVVWAAGITAPAAGSRYTVRYRYSPRYGVMSDPTSLRGSDDKNMAGSGSTRPQTVLLRLHNPNSSDPA